MDEVEREVSVKTIADLGRQAIRDNHTINELRAENTRLTAELDRWKSGAQHETRTCTSCDETTYGGGDPELADDIATEVARFWDAS